MSDSGTDPEKFPFSHQSNSWRRIILENALDAFVGMNHLGFIVDWNRQAEVIFGWNKHEAMGRSLSETIIPPEYREAHTQGTKQFFATGEGPILNHRIEIVALHRNGSIFPVELTVLPLRINGEYYFYSFIRDISEQRRTEEERGRLLEKAETSKRCLCAQYTIMSELAQASNFDEAAPKILHAIGGTLEWDFGTFWLVDPSKQILYPAHIWKPPTFKSTELVQATLNSRFPIGVGFPGIVWATRRPTWVADVLDDPNFLRSSIARRNGIRGEIAFPILGSNDTVLGVIEFFSRRIRDPNEEVITAMTTVAGQIGQFILRIREISIRMQTQDALKASESQLKLISKSLPALFSYVSSDERYQFVNGAYEIWFGEESAIAGKNLKEVLGKPTYDSVRHHIDAALAGQTVNFESTLSYRRVGNRFVNVTYVPDLDSGHAKGFFVLVNDITERKKAEEREVFLSEVSALLASSLDHESTLSNLIDLIVPRLADWCSIDLIEPRSSGLQRLVCKHRDPTKDHWIKILFDQSLKKETAPSGPVHVFRTGTAEFYPEVSDTLLDDFWQGNSEMLQIVRSLAPKAYICVPFQVRGKSLGALTLVLSEANRSYEKKDFELGLELAFRVAQAIENSILYRKLQDAVRARDEFLSIASHELKTPITSLQLRAQILLRRKERKDPNLYQPKIIDNYVDSNIRQIDRLSMLVDDMLDISRISQGKLHMQPELTDLGLLVKDVLNQFTEQLTASGYQVRSSFQENVKGLWDRFRIEQVAVNLLTNAIKYGCAKPIGVSVTSEKQEAIIRLKDHGMGIAPENLDRIFQRFERATSASEITGLGLGLYISKQIVTAHGGVIYVESDVGKGSTFTVKLPLWDGEDERDGKSPVSSS